MTCSLQVLRSELYLAATICTLLASRHTRVVTTHVQSAASHWEIWRFTLVCLMPYWLLRSFLKSTGNAVRMYSAMTVVGRALHASTGCTTNVDSVALTIPGLSSVRRQTPAALSVLLFMGGR
ncbi:hypothetical protein ACSQ67_005222 [Phaseolus vulgaris]